MTTLEAGGIKGEYLMLTYANDAKLYVPVSSLHLISRYAGVQKRMHHCINWAATRHAPGRKRRKKCEMWRPSCWISMPNVRPKSALPLSMIKSSTSCSATASRLKPRRTGSGHQCCVKRHVSAVGNGQAGLWRCRLRKTEVAMRAAFLAVENNKQVAVLVPTTLLAQQHFDNFRDRFANWPVRIEMLSRFRSTKEQTQIRSRPARVRSIF